MQYEVLYSFNCRYHLDCKNELVILTTQCMVASVVISNYLFSEQHTSLHVVVGCTLVHTFIFLL